MLDGLAARHVLFNVLYESDLTAAKLAPYKVVAMLTTRTTRQSAISALETYLTKGGKIIAAGDAATLDETGQKRSQPEWFGKKTGSGEYTYYEQLPPLDDLSKTLRDAAGPEVVHVEVPPGVLYNIEQQPATGSVMIHFLNYTLKPSAEIKVAVKKNYGILRVLSPDLPSAVQLAISGGAAVITVPPVRIYSLLVMETRGSSSAKAAAKP